ncbi:MAG: hypothetical protein K0M45_11950 [Candidatus Paracaedibacteraceae bacterium]|nr:hypothetical protein [Candidatus Paracaedibacteraceae bacterium]
MLFRKIINTFVLISYVKMLVVSSFAVDADYRVAQANQLILSIKRDLKEPNEAKRLTLEVHQQIGGVLSPQSTATLDFENFSYTGAIQPNLLGDRFDWTIAGLGTVQVDLLGRLLLKDLNFTDSTSLLKIRTDTYITLQNCQFHNLSLNSFLTALGGGNRILNLKTKTSSALGLLVSGQTSDYLKNLTVKSGWVRNDGNLQLLGGGVWDLQGHDFLTQRSLTIAAGGHTINQAGTVTNTGSVTGSTLTVQCQSYDNQASGSVELESQNIQATETIANQGKIHTPQGGQYQVGESLTNDGEMTSEGTDQFSSLNGDTSAQLVNRGQMASKEARYQQLQIVNHQTIENRRSLFQGGTLNNQKTLILGGIPHTSTLQSLVNAGSLSGTGELSIDHGENTGEMDLSRLFLTIVNEFTNKHIFHTSRLQGQGTFINQGDFKTATTNGITGIDIRRFESRSQSDKPSVIQGDKLLLKSNLVEWVMDDSTQIIVNELHIYAAPSVTSPFIINGITHCNLLNVYRKNVQHQGILEAKKLYQSASTFTFKGRGAQIEAIDLQNQARFINQSHLSVQGLALNESSLVNEGDLFIEAKEDAEDQQKRAPISGTGTLTNRSKIIIPKDAQLILSVKTVNNEGTADKPAEITGGELVVSPGVAHFSNDQGATINTTSFTVTEGYHPNQRALKNKGTIISQNTALGRALINEDTAELGVLTLHHRAKLTNKRNAQLECDLLIMPGGVLNNEGDVRLKALDVDSLDTGSYIENKGYFELHQTLPKGQGYIDGRALNLVLHNIGRFHAKGTLSYNYGVWYKNAFLEKRLNLYGGQNYDPQPYLINGAVTANNLVISELPITDKFFQALQGYQIHQRTQLDTSMPKVISAVNFNVISLNQDHNLSSLGILEIFNYFSGSSLTLKSLIAREIYLKGFQSINIDERLQTTHGPLEVKGSNHITAGLDNDRIAVIKADQDAINIQVNEQADLRYALVHAKNILEVESLNGSIRFGDSVIIPPTEVTEKLSSDLNDFLGKGTYGSTTVYCESYKPNHSGLYSETNRVILKAPQFIDGYFGSLFGAQGFELKSDTINLINTNILLMGNSIIEANAFFYSRTPNEVLSLGNISAGGHPVNCAVQTSPVATFFLLGNLEVRAPQFQLLGNNFFVSGDVTHYGRRIDRAEDLITVSAYEQWRDYYFDLTPVIITASPLALMGFFIGGGFNPLPVYTKDCVGTTGGEHAIGGTFAIDTNDNLVINGGSLSARTVSLKTNKLLLCALRQILPRVQARTVRLDSYLEALMLFNNLIEETPNHALQIRNMPAVPSQRPETIPVYHPQTNRLFVVDTPSFIPFRVDPRLEMLSMMGVAHQTIGRLYDNLGNSGLQAYEAALDTGRALGATKQKLTPDVLNTLSTFLLYYQLDDQYGAYSLVPIMHVSHSLEEDTVDASGALRMEQGTLAIEDLVQEGGRLARTGADSDLVLQVGTLKTSAVTPATGVSVNASINNEQTSTHLVISNSADMAHLDNQAKKRNTLQSAGPVVMNESTMTGQQGTVVDVKDDLTLRSSAIGTTGEGVTVVRAQSLEASKNVETIHTRQGWYQRARGEMTIGNFNAPTQMKIGQDLHGSALRVKGQSLDIQNGGNRVLDAISLFGEMQEEHKKKTVITRWCNSNRSELLAGQPTSATEDQVYNYDTPIICPGRQFADNAAFYELPISGNNDDCGFNCLGIERNAAVELLLDQADNADARAVVAPEIIMAFDKLSRLRQFRRRSDVQALKDQQTLRVQLDQEATNSLNEQLGLERDRTWRETVARIQEQGLTDHYADFLDKANRYQSFDDDLRAFAHKPDIYRLYVQTYAHQGEEGQNKRLEYLPDNYDHVRQAYQVVPSVFDLLARLLGKKLRVVHKIDDTAYELKHEDTFDGEPVTVLHTMAGTAGGYAFSDILKNSDPDDPQVGPTEYNHYNLLLSNDEYVDFLKTVNPETRSGIKPGEVYLYSEGDAHDIGLRVTAQNKIYMGARGTYAQSEVHDWWEQQVIKKKKNWYGKKKHQRYVMSHKTARVTEVTSVNKQPIHAFGGLGLILRGSIFKGGKITLETERGLIQLLTALNMTFNESSKKSKDAFWQSRSTIINCHEQRLPCQFHTTEDSIAFKTPEGIVVELVNEVHTTSNSKHNKGKPETWRRLKDYSHLPGYEWMKQLDSRDDVIRVYVDENHQTVESRHQGMSAAAKVVASIVLTICTGGAGSLLTMVTSSLMNSMIINTVDQRGRVDRAAKTTFSKESLKGLGAQILGQVLLSGVDMLGESLSKAASTTTQATTQTATQAATKAATQSVTWVDRFQAALSTSLKTNLANGAARGLVYGNWRDQLKEAGINFVTDTAAQFGAEQIGVGRKGEILQDLKVGEIDLYNYLSHKISHAALGAATRAVNAKLSGGDRKAVRKAAKGGAAGAASAEMVAEWMMPAALERIDSQLQDQGFSQGTQAYQVQHQALLKEELKLLRHCGEIAAVVSAQAIGGDIEAAQLAARNALTYNFSQMMVGIKPTQINMTPEEWEAVKKKLKWLLEDPSDHPDRIPDTEYEIMRQSMLEAVRECYEGRGRLLKGEINDATIGQTLAASGLDGVRVTSEILSLAGEIKLLMLAGKGINTGLNVICNTLGAGTEGITGNKRWGQNVADWGKIGGELFPFVQGVKAAHRARQLQALDLAEAAKATRTIEGLDLVSVSKATTIHKNSLSYVGETHLYVIRDSSGKILKYGESAAGKNQFGQSKRAQAQIRELRKQNPDGDYISQIVREFDSKLAARTSEARYIKTHRKVFGKESLTLNKNNR